VQNAARLYPTATPIATSHVGFALDDGQQFRANKTMKLVHGGVAIGLGQNVYTHCRSCLLASCSQA